MKILKKKNQKLIKLYLKLKLILKIINKKILRKIFYFSKINNK